MDRRRFVKSVGYAGTLAAATQLPAGASCMDEMMRLSQNRPSAHGMGYVVLDKDKTFAEQVTQENTIYEIRYDFDLGGGADPIQIPAGCVLKFEGGSLKNGTIECQGTFISNGCKSQIFDSVELVGTVANDELFLSWWLDEEAYDNTVAMQSCINAALTRKGSRAIVDKSVNITDIDITNKYAGGITLEGVNMSNQGEVVVTVFGSGSQGFDISGFEGFKFRNLYIKGDSDQTPATLVFATRTSVNKQVNRTLLDGVSLAGNVTHSLLYNYGGEMWEYDRCRFSAPEGYKGKYGLYATSINTEGLKSKFAETKGYGDTYENNGATRGYSSPLTVTEFRECSFSNYSTGAALFFEGGFKKDTDPAGTDITAGGLSFNKCYWHSPHAESLKLKDFAFGLTMMNCDDESGANYTTDEGKPLISIITSENTDDDKTPTNNILQGLCLIGNVFFAKVRGEVINARQRIHKYFASANHSYNTNYWRFRELVDANHYNLAPWERFEATMVYSADVNVPSIHNNVTLTDNTGAIAAQKDSALKLEGSPIHKVYAAVGAFAVTENKEVYVGYKNSRDGWIMITPKVLENPFAPANYQTYEKGQILTSNNPYMGFAEGYVASSGTTGTINFTCSGASGSNEITVNNTSFGIKAGEYVKVGNSSKVTARVLSVSGTKITLSENVKETGEELALTYANPKIFPCSRIYTEQPDEGYISASGYRNGSKVLFSNDKMEATVYGEKFYYADGFPVYRRRGFESQKPTGLIYADIGSPFYHREIRQPSWWNGEKWTAADGYAFVKRSGDTESRPTGLTQSDAGLVYFDTTLGKPIWWKGAAWVDAMGEIV